MIDDEPFVKMIMLRIVSTICFALLFLPHAHAQSRLLGRVLDREGNPVIAAIVSLDGGKKTGAVLTNGDGYYTFLGLPDGKYAVRVSKRGQPTAQSNVSLGINATMMLNVKLTDVALADATRVAKPPVEKPADKPKEKSRDKNDKSKQKMADLAKAREDSARAAEILLAGRDSVVQEQGAVGIEVASVSGDPYLEKAIAEAEAMEALRRRIYEKSVSIVGGVEVIYKYLQYPYSAKNTAEVVNVAARIYVSEVGKVIKVDMIKTGPPLFNEEVYRVLTEDVKFTPAQLAGKPSAGTMTVVVDFKP
jgi:hypothetical protein